MSKTKVREPKVDRRTLKRTSAEMDKTSRARASAKVRRYQGREKTSILQANTKKELDVLIRSSRAFARKHGMEDFKVVKHTKDPDGGYKAIVTAHNWNPIKWVKEKISRRKEKPGVTDEVPPTEEGWRGVVIGERQHEEENKKRWEEEAAKQRDFAEAEPRMRERFRTAGFDYEDLKKQGDPSRLHRAYDAVKKHEERTFGEKYRDVAYGHGPDVEEFGTLPKGERKKADKAWREGTRSRVHGDIDIYAQEVPSEITQMQRVWQQGHYINRETGEPIPEPQTAEEKKQAIWKPAEYVFKEVTRKLTPIEQRKLARELKLEEMQLRMTEGKYKDWERERKPIVKAARAIGGFGQFMAGATAVGIAGTAQTIAPRSEPRRARGLAPRVDPSIYTVRTPSPMGYAPPAAANGLAHLRSATFPGGMRTAPARRIPLAPRPRPVDISRLRRRRGTQR